MIILSEFGKGHMKQKCYQSSQKMWNTFPGVDDEYDDYQWDEGKIYEHDDPDDNGPWGEGLVDVLPGGVDDPKSLPAVSETLEIY